MGFVRMQKMKTGPFNQGVVMKSPRVSRQTVQVNG